MSSQPSSPCSSHGLPSPPDSPDQYPSDAESLASNSSFPSVSVSSSFFFSSAAHSPHTQSEGGNSSEVANQGLIIPSLALPEALRRPTPWGKTTGDLRVLVLDLVDGHSQSQQSQSPSHDMNLNILVKTLLRENEDVVEVDAHWEWDEVGHVPVRVLHASTDWIEHSDAHGLEKYDPTRNIQLLDVGTNDLQAIKRIVLAPFLELSNVLPSSSSSTSSSSIGLLANLISAPTTPLYTVLLLLLPQEVHFTYPPKYAEIRQCLGQLIPILPILIPSSSANSGSGPSLQYKFTINPTYSPSYHHHRHPDHPLASTHPYHPASKSGSRIQSGDVLSKPHDTLLHPSTISPPSQTTTTSIVANGQHSKPKPITLTILRNMLFRPDAQSSHTVTGTGTSTGSPGSIVSLRAEAAELFLRWWRVEGIVMDIVGSSNALSTSKLMKGMKPRDRQERTIMRLDFKAEGEGGERIQGAQGGNGSWSIFKAKWEKEWERKWDGMEEELSKDVAVRLREVKEKKGRERFEDEGEREREEENREFSGEDEESLVVSPRAGVDSRVEKEEKTEKTEAGTGADGEGEPEDEIRNDGALAESAPSLSESSALQTESEPESQADAEIAEGASQSQTDNDSMEEEVIFQLDLSPRLSHTPDHQCREKQPLALNKTNSYSSLSSFEARYNHGFGLGLEDEDSREQSEEDEDVGRTLTATLSRTVTTKDLPLPPAPPPTSNTSPQPLTSLSEPSPSSSLESPIHQEVQIVDPTGHKDMTPTPSVSVLRLSPQVSPKTPRPLVLMRASTVRDNRSGSGKGKMSTVSMSNSNTGSGTVRRRMLKAKSRSRSTSPSNPSSPAFPRTISGSGSYSYSRRPGVTRMKTKDHANRSPSSSKVMPMTTSSAADYGSTPAQVRYEEDEHQYDHAYGHDEELLGLGFDPLHLPSLLMFSLSLFRPLRDRVRMLIVGSDHGPGPSVNADANEGVASASSTLSSPEASISTAVGQRQRDAEAKDEDSGSTVGRNRLSIFVVSLGVGVGLGYVIGRMNRVECAV